MSRPQAVADKLRGMLHAQLRYATKNFTSGKLLRNLTTRTHASTDSRRECCGTTHGNVFSNIANLCLTVAHNVARAAAERVERRECKTERVSGSSWHQRSMP